MTPLPGAFFAVHVDDGSARDYRITDSAGVIAERFAEDGRVRPIGPAEREWIAGAIGEFARRAPIAPMQRAMRIYERGGLDAVFAEGSRIPSDEIRAEYFVTPLLSMRMPAADRASYIRRASLELGTSNALARFLLSVPSEWRRDSVVTLRILLAASRIEPDEDALNVLRRVAPAGPLSGDFAEAVRSIIATLQSVDDRTAMTSLYFSRKQP
jgi:hypothetical protein